VEPGSRGATRSGRRERDDTPAPANPWASRAAAMEKAEPWINDLLQIADPGRHPAALDAIRDALRSDDPIDVEAGLLALTQTRTVHYDRASFRPLVLPHLNSTTAAVRLASLYALLNTETLPEDVDRIVPLADDPVPRIRTTVPYVLVAVTKGDFTGAPGRALLKLLNDPDYRLVIDAMRGIGGVRKYPPEVVDRFLELASDKGKRHDILHFAMMNMPKPKRVIDAMLGYLDDRTQLQTVGTGLQRGIPKELKDYLCREILARMEDSDARAQGVYLTILSFHADGRHREALQRLLDEEVILPRFEGKAKGILGRMR
jgi:hypothetical protein